MVEDRVEYTVEYRLWDKEKLESEGIDTNKLSSKEIFIIRYDLKDDEVDVASVLGFIDTNGKKHHLLSDL